MVIEFNKYTQGKKSKNSYTILRMVSYEPENKEGLCLHSKLRIKYSQSVKCTRQQKDTKQ